MTGAEPPLFLTRGDVARHLGLPLRQLTWWVWALDERKRYTTFEVQKRSAASVRTISAPIKPLKDIQRMLATTLQAVADEAPHVHGFVPGRSIITNAEIHRRKEWVLRLDLEDFFPTINFGRVRGMFRAFPFDYPDDPATLLAAICCHERRLPQGAPTSPVVSNLICRQMDAELSKLARAERCHYTRYADDLCFSTDRKRFPPSLATVEDGVSSAGGALNAVIVRNGLKVNEAKTRLVKRTQRQRVTGLVVNEKVNVSRDYVRGLRGLLFVWKHHGQPAAEPGSTDRAGRKA